MDISSPLTQLHGKKTARKKSALWKGLDVVLLQLLLLFLDFDGPGEVSDRDDEEAVEILALIALNAALDIPVGVVEDTGQGVIPGQEGSHQCEKASGFDNGWIWLTGGVRLQVADTEKQESQI